MKRAVDRFRWLPALTLIALLALSAMGQSGEKNTAATLTKKERDFLVQYLQDTKKELLDEIRGLSETQMKFKPNPFTWSIAGNVEHITVVEEFVFSRITEEIMKSPARPDLKGEKGPLVGDITAIVVATNRNAEKFRFRAPAAFRPAKKLYATSQEAIADFGKTRAKALSFAESTREDLRSHFAEHVLIGTIDAYQWMLFIGSHSERHMAQIREIKANPNFPKK